MDGTHRYNFYVLSTEGDKVSLIMSNNICSDGTIATSTNKCTVSWTSKTDYNDNTNYGKDGNNNKGPITAMNYLHKATKNWNNIENIRMDYIDEGSSGSHGYGTIKTNGNTTKITKNGKITVTVTYTNLKARMIKLSEMEGAGCTTSSGSCPTWMVNGLHSITSYYPTGTKEDISGILGYWSLSSKPSLPSRIVFCHGLIDSNYVYDSNNYGIRPVIEVLKSDLS